MSIIGITVPSHGNSEGVLFGLLQLQVQFFPAPPIPIHLIPLNIYKQESFGARVIKPNAGELIFTVSTRVIKKPLLVALKSSSADASGVAPVSFIPTFWALVI